MTSDPSRSIRLFGTDEQAAPPKILRAGLLTAEFEAGNLRYVRYGGTEVMRAVSFIIRDKDWGTYNPVLSNLEIVENKGHFVVAYDARAADTTQAFSYSARIEGWADGRLVFSGEGAGETDFLTNRTGFVILHPIDVAGTPVEMTHVDGSVVRSRFPEVVDPVQPMMDLRVLRHWTGDGLTVTCRMEGDTYEMEDQRNWTDASYKTYVRPLALPWPYSLAKGESIRQSVTLTVEGQAESRAADEVVTIAVGAAVGKVPALGQGLDPDDSAAALAASARIAVIGAAHLICHHDPRRGHGRDSLTQQLAVARAAGADPWLEAVIVSVDAYTDELEALGALVAELGAPFSTILVSPAPDMKCTLPGSVWPETPPAADLYRVARRVFPGKRIGGGMFSYFTELNRKRPPAEALDLVSFTTSPMVHAGDDRSVMETIRALTSIVTSLPDIVGDKPYAVGPSAIGVRDNPYGEAPKDNPGNIRQAMNWNDPRQRGQLGAAWNLAYFAGFAYGGAEAIALGAPVGAFGAVSVPTTFPQPWFVENGGAYPLFHVLRGLAGLQGAPLLELSVSRPDVVEAIAAETLAGHELWLANMGETPVAVAVPDGFSQIAVLDAAAFTTAAADPNHLDTWGAVPAPSLTLDAYAVARLRSRPIH